MVDHIYVGGGTPSIAYRYFPMLSSAIRESFAVKDGAEFSMECNPESVTPEFINAAKDFGVNRVSVGVQSLSDPILRSIGRAHDRTRALDALKALTENFPSVNADVMVGLPGQCMEDVAETIEMLLAYPINHLSCYSLILEEGTPLYDAAEKGEFTPDDDFSVDMYDYVRDRLSQAGFTRYEISNFCKGEAVCEYNLSVWQYGEYLGLGLGASSFMREGGVPFGVRSTNTNDLAEYIASHGSIGSAREEIEKGEAMREFVMLGLRLEEGLDLSSFLEIFGVDFTQIYGENVKKIEKMLVITDKHVAIAPEYFYISNDLIGEILY